MNYQNASLFHSKHSVDLFCITRPFSMTSVHLLWFPFEGSNCTHKAPEACPFFSAEAHLQSGKEQGHWLFSLSFEDFVGPFYVLMGEWGWPWMEPSESISSECFTVKKMTCSLATEEPLCHSEDWRGTWSWEIWRSCSFR